MTDIPKGKGLIYWINKKGPIDTFPRNKKEFDRLLKQVIKKFNDRHSKR